MGILKESKLNQLLGQWLNGRVLTSSWLTQHGYSPQLVKKYCDNNWLKKLGTGAYIKIGDQLNWAGAVHALQIDLELPIHLGGLSALEFHGLAQNVVFDKKQIQFQLFNTTNKQHPLPLWFKKIFVKCYYAQRNLFDTEIGLDIKEINNIKLLVSSAERASLEMLALVPQNFDYEHAYNLVENLQLIRPKVMQELLERCLSIKTKRLFLYLADKHQLPCFSYLNIHKIDLGKGKRVIGVGGMYVPKYQLSVPVVEQENVEGIEHV